MRFVRLLAAISVIIVSSTPRVAASQAGAEQLKKSFRVAHDRRDADAIERLFFWGSSDSATRNSTDRAIRADFGMSIKSIAIEPLAQHEMLSYTLHGASYRPSLPPIGHLKVTFQPPASGLVTSQSTSYLVGVRNGVYLLVTAVPER